VRLDLILKGMEGLLSQYQSQLTPEERDAIARRYRRISDNKALKEMIACLRQTRYMEFVRLVLGNPGLWLGPTAWRRMFWELSRLFGVPRAPMKIGS
jgi:hypothetical protein